MSSRLHTHARDFLLRVGLLLLTTLSLNAQSPVAQHGQLSVSGNQIVDASGKATQLKGMSLFWSQWMPQFYTSGTVNWLADDWNCSVVRAAMAVDEGGYATAPAREQAKIETVVEAAIAKGIYVIIDFHTHHAEDYRAEAKKFFGDMARKYGNEPNVIYEIYNEPLDVSWSNVIKPYALEVIESIRAHDPDNIIVVGTRQWSQKVSEPAADPIRQDNIAYTLHFYAGSHGQSLRDEAKRALDAGLAIVVTEYGSTLANGDGDVYRDETRKWWDFLDQHNLSHANWSVADKREGSAALTPGASGNGGWPLSEITESGRFTRDELRSDDSDGGDNGDEDDDEDDGGDGNDGDDGGNDDDNGGENDEACSGEQPVDLDFKYDGTGQKCWVISDDIKYVNSWSTSKVTINGQDYTNAWSSQMPAKVDGKYYVSYSAELPWSHFEAFGGASKSLVSASKSGSIATADFGMTVYPNPFSRATTIEFTAPDAIEELHLTDLTGQVVRVLKQSQIQHRLSLGSELANGVYILSARTETGRHTLRIVKQ